MKARTIILSNLLLLMTISGAKSQTQTSFAFPALPYGYDALEQFIDKATMEFHYDKHFRSYYNNFIKAVEANNLNGKSIEEIFSEVSKFPAALRNSGGGYYNHALFWEVMSPNGGGMPTGQLLQAITDAFGSYENFVKEFEKAATSLFGSGWAWLSIDATGKLFVSQLPNQDNPLMDIASKRGTPILALDVWEHAYYLKYQNKRGDYVTNFWKVVNWIKVNDNFIKAKK